jgi:hypothetical protein
MQEALKPMRQLIESGKHMPEVHDLVDEME